ncbi:GNAT family N-acetyltransferase [Pararhodobacter sp.]|uniref:GNAT family N-acetyltransferase n=1 Tax=Pararhodobacter sp. TaxID=2127056 RepID=UPI002AFE6AEA|nr:GNAT family N-acyltransferase [Pararhodobacter sp.]
MTRLQAAQRQTMAYDVRLASSEVELLAAQRLRYAVFVEELGATGLSVDHAQRLERDLLDPHFDHLLLIDRNIPPETLDHVIGAYRLLPQDRAEALGRFYSDAEYDLGPLRRSGRKLVELGRSCVHRNHRRGVAMLHLWNGLAAYVLARDIKILFGVASFHGTDPAHHAAALTWLHTHHLAPPELRVTVWPDHAQPMDLMPIERVVQAEALAAIPPLIRAYLRLGGFVGEGAFIDHDFNTTDVCLILDTATMSERAVDHYTRKTARR